MENEKKNYNDNKIIYFYFCLCDQKEKRHQNTVVSVGLGTKKFNIVSNNHGSKRVIFPFSTGNTLFEQIWSKKNQNCQFKLKLDTYNHFHNILRLFDVLSNFPFTSSETVDSLKHKHGTQELPHELPKDFRQGF